MLYLAERLTEAFQAIQALLSADLLDPFEFGCCLRLCASWETEPDGQLFGFRCVVTALF